MSRFLRVQMIVVLFFVLLLLQGCVAPTPPPSEDDITGASVETTNDPDVTTSTSSTETLDSPNQVLNNSNPLNVTSQARSTLGTNGPPRSYEMTSSSEPPTVNEHKGTKTSWEALRAKVVGEINEHQRQIQQLNLKLQLVDQIATRLELTTKAVFQKGQAIVADFAIENPTTYALKDISIACAQIAPTGTIISSFTETIYAIVDANATQTFERVELDQLHKQTQALNCEIKNFTVHTPSTNLSQSQSPS